MLLYHLLTHRITENRNEILGLKHNEILKNQSNKPSNQISLLRKILLPTLNSSYVNVERCDARGQFVHDVSVA